MIKVIFAMTSAYQGSGRDHDHSSVSNVLPLTALIDVHFHVTPMFAVGGLKRSSSFLATFALQSPVLARNGHHVQAGRKG